MIHPIRYLYILRKLVIFVIFSRQHPLLDSGRMHGSLPGISDCLDITFGSHRGRLVFCFQLVFSCILICSCSHTYLPFAEPRLFLSANLPLRSPSVRPRRSPGLSVEADAAGLLLSPSSTASSTCASWCTRDAQVKNINEDFGAELIDRQFLPHFGISGCFCPIDVIYTGDVQFDNLIQG